MDQDRKMRLSRLEHERQPWRIHELASGFTLEDVWALPVRGGVEDFQGLLDLTYSLDPAATGSSLARLLFGLRDRLGTWFGLDQTPVSAGSCHAPSPADGHESSLRRRLPPDLRGTASGASFASLPLSSVYRLDREAAAEISNRIVHGIAHLGWVRLDGGRYEGRLAVYVRPRGVLGGAYMALIKPFRHRIVYPALLRQMERAWNESPRAARSHRDR